MERNNYIKAINKLYVKAVKRIVKRIANNFANTLPEASYQEVVDKVLYVIYLNWDKEFVNEITPSVNKYVNSIYRKYRKDKKPLKGLKKIPKPDFNLSDIRALKYFSDNDNFYLGRFITDDSTTRKITEYIKETYLENGGEIGRSKEYLNKFKNEFAEVLIGEDWKIRRVLDTTVSRMRNIANINYMQQAEVTEYEIVEVMDNRTCGYCQVMNGKKFSVQEQYNRTKNLEFKGDEVKQEFPFITSVFRSPADLKELTAKQLSNVKITAPPYHPACRGRIIAVLD